MADTPAGPRITGHLEFARAEHLAAARAEIESDRALSAACAGGWDDGARRLSCDAAVALGPASSAYLPTRPGWMTALSRAARHAKRGRLDLDFGRAGPARSWRVEAGGFIAPVVGDGSRRDSVGCQELSPVHDDLRPGPAAFSAAGTSIFVGGGSNLTRKNHRAAVCAVVELDTATLSDQRWFTGFDGPVVALACSPDDQRLYAVDSGGNLKSFDRHTGEQKSSRRIDAGETLALRCCPDGTLLSASGRGFSRLSASLKPLAGSPLAGGNALSASALAFSPDASLVAAARVGVDVWSVSRPDARLGGLATRAITSMAFSPCGERLAIVEAIHDGLTFFSDVDRWSGPEAPKRVRLLEARTLRELWCREDLGNPSSVAFCGGERLLCAGRQDDRWTLWALAAGDGRGGPTQARDARAFSAYPNPCPDRCSLAVAADGAAAALAFEAGVLLFRNLA